MSSELQEIAAQNKLAEWAEITPARMFPSGNVAVTVRISGAEDDIHSGTDIATVEAVL